MAETIWVKEVGVNEDRNCQIYRGEPRDTETEQIGEVFREARSEYGRCIGHVYVDKKDGSTEAIGWVFEKREKYTDCDETYLQVTWVTLCRPTDLPQYTTVALKKWSRKGERLSC